MLEKRSHLPRIIIARKMKGSRRPPMWSKKPPNLNRSPPRKSKQNNSSKRGRLAISKKNELWSMILLHIISILINHLILLRRINSRLCSSESDWANSLSVIILMAYSFSILLSCRSMSSPILDHCWEVKFSASSGVTTSLNVTISLSCSSSLLVNDSFLPYSSSL